MPMEHAVVAAERYIVSTCIFQPHLLDEIKTQHTDFVNTHRGFIFRATRYLFDNGVPITSATIMDKCGKRVPDDILSEAIDPSYSAPWAIREHDAMVRQSGLKRRLREASMKISNIVELMDDVDDEVISQIQTVLSDFDSMDTSDTGLVKISDLLPDHIEQVEERTKTPGQIPGISTGSADLDDVIGGFQLQDLTIIAARPSMGKTAFLLQCAQQAAQKDVAAIFELEMREGAILDRAIASMGNIKMYHLTTGSMDEDDWPKLSMATGALGNLELYLDCTPAVTVSYMKSRLRRLKRQIPSDRRLVVFVDYLQIVKPESGRSREQEVSDISRKLKQMAKELDCAVVSLAQLSRNVENRQDKHPVMADIRESGSIEQDADTIGFLYRDEYYDPMTELKNVMEVIIAKQRNGKTGKVNLVFLPDTQRIVNLAKPERSE